MTSCELMSNMYLPMYWMYYVKSPTSMFSSIKNVKGKKKGSKYLNDRLCDFFCYVTTHEWYLETYVCKISSLFILSLVIMSPWISGLFLKIRIFSFHKLYMTFLSYIMHYHDTLTFYNIFAWLWQTSPSKIKQLM